jgi:hypothetical protein
VEVVTVLVLVLSWDWRLMDSCFVSMRSDYYLFSCGADINCFVGRLVG